MEVKGRRVFGVPLLLSAQQTGEPIPPCILRALVYLRTNCLDQVNQQKPAGIEEAVFNKLCQKCSAVLFSGHLCFIEVEETIFLLSFTATCAFGDTGKQF